MKTIFFNNPVGTDKLQFTVSDKSVDKLKSDGIIPKKSKTVSYPLIDENSALELRTLVVFPDRCTFNDYENPTEVIVDIELIHSFVLNQLKVTRATHLEELDKLQVRYIAMGKTDVVAEIEADKQALRDVTDTLDFSKASDYVETMKVARKPVMTENYKMKYS